MALTYQNNNDMATSDASPASPRSPRAQEVPQTDALRTEAEALFKDEMSTLEHSYRTTLLELFYWRRGHSQSEPSPPTADLASMDWEQLDQSHDFTTFAAAHPLQPTSSDDDTAMETIIPKIEELEAVSTSEKADETPTPIPPLVSKVIQSMPVARYRERPAHPKKTRIIPYGKRTKSRHQRKQAIQRTLELYAWQYKVQQQPLFKVLPSARKFVPTSHWRVARDELKSFRALQRVEVLKNQNQWSFRQLEKHEAPTRTKTHWDYLLDEMQWLQADFKEERRWKIAMAYQVSQWVMEWHQSTDKSALCVKSTIPSLQASHASVKPAAQPSGILPKPPTTPTGDPLNRENWLQCLDPNSGLVLDDQLSQEIMAHYYEYPLFVPPIYDEQAQYEDLLEHGQTVPISALMSTMVAFDLHQPPTTTWADQPLQTVPQKRTADPLDEYLAVLDKESATLAGDSERLTLTDKPSEAQDMLDHPNDYCLADSEYTTFSTTMFDGGYPGDHTVHQLTKTARSLPGNQLYHGQHVISPLFAHQKSQDGHSLSPALTVQTSSPDVPATVDAAMWTSEEEALLQELVDQYGPYWNLVSDALTASDHIPGSTPRNARDCYDRWNVINHALVRPVDRGLIPSTPLSATSTLVAGEHGQATPEIQTMGADEKRGQRLQSFMDAIRKTSKRRQETQQRMQQTLATRSKKLGSFMMASAPDANGTEGNTEPSKSIIAPGEAGSDATKPATDDKGAS
ncbi:chromatin modification- protein VID21, partial [Dispira simplex]